jgi:hypothetical protein
MSITVFYTPRMVADSQSYSPVPASPGMWCSHGCSLAVTLDESSLRSAGKPLNMGLN